MKLHRIMKACAIVTLLALSADSLLAQGGPGGMGGGMGGGPGGMGGGMGGGPGGGMGGGNFDPAAMQQRMLDRYQEQLEFTNDVEWDAVKPLVQKVIEAQTAARSGGMGGMMGGRGGRGGRGGGMGGMGGAAQANPEREALQKALDDNAPAAQVKDLLAKYKASVKVKQTKLAAAQADLKKVLNTRQEALATLANLVE